MKRTSIWSVLVLVTLFFTSCGDGENGKPVEASNKNIDSLLQVYPDSIPLLLQRGEKRFEEYKYDLALNDAAKAFRLDSNNLDARLLYAEVINSRANRSNSDVTSAQWHYNKVLSKRPKDLRALVGIASTYSYQQDFEKSFKYINKALRIDKKYRDAYVLKGSNYRVMGKIDLAKSSYETAIQQDPEFFAAYFMLGNIYQAEGNKICTEYFRSAYNLKPELEVLYQLAYSEQMLGDATEAQVLYRKMVSDTSDFYQLRGLFHQGSIHQFYYKDLDSAMYYYKSALKTDPRHVESWCNLGIVYFERGDKTKALESLSKALEYDPKFEFARHYADSIRLL